MLIDILRQRRSIRQFQSTPVEPKKIDQLIEAALRAPSSRGRNPWEFIVVTDGNLLEKLGKAKQHGSDFLARVPLAIVIVADPQKCDVWVEDCSIAAIIVQLMAVDLGLGSCWAQIRLRPHTTRCSAEDYIRELLDIPDKLVVECVIGIGYPAEQKEGHSQDSLLINQVHRDRFSG